MVRRYEAMHPLGLPAFVAFDKVVIDLLPVSQQPKAITFDLAVVDKHILLVRPDNESKPLFRIKPFDLAPY